jgi:hypothetical protein
MNDNEAKAFGVVYAPDEILARGGTKKAKGCHPSLV